MIQEDDWDDVERSFTESEAKVEAMDSSVNLFDVVEEYARMKMIEKKSKEKRQQLEAMISSAMGGDSMTPGGDVHAVLPGPGSAQWDVWLKASEVRKWDQDILDDYDRHTDGEAVADMLKTICVVDKDAFKAADKDDRQRLERLALTLKPGKIKLTIKKV